LTCDRTFVQPIISSLPFVAPQRTTLGIEHTLIIVGSIISPTMEQQQQQASPSSSAIHFENQEMPESCPHKLEDAIPAHLQVAVRTRPLGCPVSFVPKTVSISSRFDVDVKEIVMLVFGVQTKPVDGAQPPQARVCVLGTIQQALAKVQGPEHFDVCAFKDQCGYQTDQIVAYWKSKAQYDQWQGDLAQDWWFQPARITPDVGVYKEEYVIDVRRTETTFSHSHPEGYSHLASAWSGPTDKHEYYGSARDRIPASQTDALKATGTLHVTKNDGAQLVHVTGHDNVCLLRSGQVWKMSCPQEGADQEANLRPALRTAMTDLTMNGQAKGCYFNRFMAKTSGDKVLDSTLSFSAWRSLADLEQWTRTSREHGQLFALGVQHYDKHGDDAALELYHELYVLPQNAQDYCYYNCHAQTGMLAASNGGLVETTAFADVANVVRNA
jgi:aldoxime dehydratase